MLKDVATFVWLDHREVGTTHFVSETVESSRDICVGLKINPSAYVFIVWNLSDDELLAKVFMVYHKSCVTEHMLDLNLKKANGKLKRNLVYLNW